jgi:hypothetical protein
MPELVYSPFAALAFHYEAEKSQAPGEAIDFTGFVNIISILSPKADPLEKVEYMCAVLKVGYDVAPPEPMPNLGGEISPEAAAAAAAAAKAIATKNKYLHKEEISSIMYQLCLGTVPPPVLEKIMDRMWDTITAADPEARTRGITKNDLAALFCSLDLQTYLTLTF